MGYSTTYKIKVKTLEGQILTYTNVKSYEIEGGFLTFTDSKTQEVKRFHGSKCEIIEDEKRGGE